MCLSTINKSKQTNKQHLWEETGVNVLILFIFINYFYRHKCFREISFFLSYFVLAFIKVEESLFFLAELMQYEIHFHGCLLRVAVLGVVV